MTSMAAMAARVLALLALLCAAAAFLPAVVPRSSQAWRSSVGVRRPHAAASWSSRSSSRTGLWMTDESAPVGTSENETYIRLQTAELGSQLKGTNVYFVGMMGTGKTAAAKSLADRMGRYTFMDTDTIIEQLMQAPIADVFAEHGEEEFRDIEARVLNELHSYIKMVIATGGGIVKEKRNWGKLQTGLVVWLDMPVEHIVARLMKDEAEVAKRPLLQGGDVKQRLQAIYEERKPMYEQADVRISVSPDDSVDDVVLASVTSLQQFIDSNPPKWQQWKDSAKASGINWVN